MDYLNDTISKLEIAWPQNSIVNIVCHGHSVPAGYTHTPVIEPFTAYPHLFHQMLHEKYPTSSTNVIVSAIGGENSAQGSVRFERDVLNHRPDLVTIDYGLNDRDIGLQKAEIAWRQMIESALSNGTKVILLTPTWDDSYLHEESVEWRALTMHAEQIQKLASEYNIGLVDSFLAFGQFQTRNRDVSTLLATTNHPNRLGHQIVAELLFECFSKSGGQ